MKLLLITQVVDSEHVILGFFHRWIEEFAKHSEHVHVICLEEGTHSLPANVTVHSLGKEVGKGKLQILLTFYTLIWQLRHDYDNVFVHMNQLYVVLGGVLWRLWHKKVGLWYTHGSVSFSLRVATILTHKVFTASAESFRLKSDKVLVTGHGIDMERFSPQSIEKDIDLVTVGRITPVKNILTLIDILNEVRLVAPATLTIVGTAVTEVEKAYEAKLRTHIANLSLTEYVHFTGKVTQAALPTLLQRAKVFVTAAENGSLDKAMLEAMASGLPIVSSAEGSRSLPLGTGQVATNEVFIQELLKVIESGDYSRPDFVTYMNQHHSLQSLIPKLVQSFTQ